MASGPLGQLKNIFVSSYPTLFYRFGSVLWSEFFLKLDTH